MTRAAMRGALPRVLLAVFLWVAQPWVAAEVAVPPLKARVIDLTATLTPDQRSALEQKLAALEARKGSQVAVLMVPTVQPEMVEQYAIRVFDQWKLGRKGVDDGVLLLIAKNDRKLRIEVGRGLEGAIPDAYAKRIIDEEITPRFKQGDFHGGIEAGAARITKLIDGEAMPAPKSSALSRQDEELIWMIVFILVPAFLVGGVIREIFGRLLGSGITGIIAGVVLSMWGGALAGAVLVAILAFLVNLFGPRGNLPVFTASPGRWSSGGSGSSSGGSGGGFSGGGGSSGGGGASGSW